MRGAFCQFVEKEKYAIDIPQNSFACQNPCSCIAALASSQRAGLAGYGQLLARAELTRSRCTSPEWISALRRHMPAPLGVCAVLLHITNHFQYRIFISAFLKYRSRSYIPQLNQSEVTDGERQSGAPASLRCFVAKTCPRKLRPMSFLREPERVLRPRREGLTEHHSVEPLRRSAERCRSIGFRSGLRRLRPLPAESIRLERNDYRRL